MFVVIITSVIALFLTFLESNGKTPDGMKWGFVLVTILGAIHYDYGNDYMSYYQFYRDCQSIPFNFKDIIEGNVSREPGWALLNYAFRYLGGFFSLVAVLTIVQNIVIYRFIRNEVSKEWYPLAVFIYLFTTSYYLMSFSMMRQWFVVCVFLGMWPLIKQKKWWIPLIVLYLCHFVHSSAIIMSPFAFWGFMPMRNSKLYSLLFSGLIIALWISGNWVDSLLESVMIYTETDYYVEKYKETEGKAFTIGIGLLIQFLPLIVGIYYLFKAGIQYEDKKRLVSISLLGSAITPLISILPIIGRMGLYFSAFGIATISITYSFIKNKPLRIALLGLLILIKTYDYIIFFSNPIWILKYSTFHTIFGQL